MSQEGDMVNKVQKMLCILVGSVVSLWTIVGMKPKHMYKHAYWSNNLDILVSWIPNNGQNVPRTGYEKIHEMRLKGQTNHEYV